MEYMKQFSISFLNNSVNLKQRNCFDFDDTNVVVQWFEKYSHIPNTKFSAQWLKVIKHDSYTFSPKLTAVPTSTYSVFIN